MNIHDESWLTCECQLDTTKMLNFAYTQVYTWLSLQHKISDEHILQELITNRAAHHSITCNTKVQVAAAQLFCRKCSRVAAAKLVASTHWTSGSRTCSPASASPRSACTCAEPWTSPSSLPQLHWQCPDFNVKPYEMYITNIYIYI